MRPKDLQTDDSGVVGEETDCCSKNELLIVLVAIGTWKCAAKEWDNMFDVKEVRIDVHRIIERDFSRTALQSELHSLCLDMKTDHAPEFSHDHPA